MFSATTIVAVKRNGRVAMAGDGQVTLGNSTIMKTRARKVRRLYHGQVLAGFAGSVADAFALFEKFERRLEQHRGNLARAVVELAKEWRSDRVLRRLEAQLLVANHEQIFLVSGSGEVIEPDDGLAAIGSGGSLALAAAKAMVAFSDLSAGEIAEQALHIAADLCVFTNHEITVEELEAN
ncbi:MAG: ATP-dependent protease subunit HslV [Firmicutes bacterium]|mgnify:CR=1 FL=1|nr:ATP-dependent protease subunit HslV [Bacillota bacterium]